MFKCDNCKKVSEPYDKLFKVVAKERVRKYYHIVIKSKNGYRTKRIVNLTLDQLNNYKEQTYDEHCPFKIVKIDMSKGKEIVRERNVCESCFRLQKTIDKVKNAS